MKFLSVWILLLLFHMRTSFAKPQRFTVSWRKHTGWVLGGGFLLGPGFSTLKQGKSASRGLEFSFPIYCGYKNLFLSTGLTIKGDHLTNGSTVDSHYFQRDGQYNFTIWANSLSYRYRIYNAFSVLSGVGFDLYKASLKESSEIDGSKPTLINKYSGQTNINFSLAVDYNWIAYDRISAFHQGPVIFRLAIKYSNYNSDQILSKAFFISLGLFYNLEFYKKITREEYEERGRRREKKNRFLFD